MIYLWVVEMLIERSRVMRWEPTLGVRFSKADALAEAKEWRAKNPSDRFRVRKYSPEGRAE